ncbi:hypothetical protein QSI_1711 [Clostridioides difficile P28]|nr:hypothetical protein QSI_1711 [Clostridioides difficile P28]
MKDKGKWLHSSHHLLIVAEIGDFCLLFVKMLQKGTTNLCFLL